MNDIFTELNLETLAAVFRREITVPSTVQSMSNEKIERLDVTAIGDRVRLRELCKKAKRRTAGHRLALEVLEAPQQTEQAMYGRNEYVFSIPGVLGRSPKI